MMGAIYFDDNVPTAFTSSNVVIRMGVFERVSFIAPMPPLTLSLNLKPRQLPDVFAKVKISPRLHALIDRVRAFTEELKQSTKLKRERSARARDQATKRLRRARPRAPVQAAASWKEPVARCSSATWGRKAAR